MTVSSNPGEATTTTTTTKIADIPTSLPENINTSGRTMRRRIEQGLPSQAITLFAPIGMAEDLTKVQLILCKEIKSEIQDVKKLITSIPHLFKLLASEIQSYIFTQEKSRQSLDAFCSTRFSLTELVFNWCLNFERNSLRTIGSYFVTFCGVHGETE